MAWFSRAGGRSALSRLPFGRVLGVLIVLALGVVIGMQYMTPDKRVLAVMAATVIAGIAWRLDTVSGLGMLILALPYQRGTVFGTTNFAFILLLLLIWLLRVAQRQSPLPRGTPVDIPIVGLLFAYAISFYNINDPIALGRALQNTELFAASVVLFYMVVNNVRTEDDLARLQTFQAVSITTIMLLAIFELNHPGGVFIPGWIEFRQTVGTEFNLRNVRVGGPFFDFELLSEFCALNTLLIWFLILRARSFYRRAALTLVLLLDVFVLFATVTRGSVIALVLGIAYLAFRMRRRLGVVQLTLGAAALAAAAVSMNFYVANFTRSGSLGARLHETKFIGIIPDDRIVVWRDAWELFLQHPLIGHGPYYAEQIGTHITFWPHDIYLYLANLVGLLGLGFFVALLFRLFVISKTAVDDPQHPRYSRAFLLVSHVQLVVFMIDEVKIEYLRNSIYQFEVWVMFAVLVATHRIATASPVKELVLQPIPVAA